MTTAQRRALATRLHAEGLTVREIAEHLGVSVGTAHRDVNPEAAERYRESSRRAQRSRPDSRRPQKRNEHIVRMWNAGSSSARIAEALGMSDVAVRSRLHRLRHKGVLVQSRSAGRPPTTRQE